VENDGRGMRERNALSGMMDEERVGGWIMRLEWMWVVDEKIESTR